MKRLKFNSVYRIKNTLHTNFFGFTVLLYFKLVKKKKNKKKKKIVKSRLNSMIRNEESIGEKNLCVMEVEKRERLFTDEKN